MATIEWINKFRLWGFTAPQINKMRNLVNKYNTVARSSKPFCDAQFDFVSGEIIHFTSGNNCDCSVVYDRNLGLYTGMEVEFLKYGEHCLDTAFVPFKIPVHPDQMNIHA